MPITVVCGCGKAYSFKDDMIGKRVACPACQQVITVEPPAGAVGLDRAFNRDKFLLRQKHFSLHQKYHVWDEQGQDILFVERPTNWGRTLLAAAAGTLAAVVGIAFAIAVTIALSQFGEALTIVGLLIGLTGGIAFIITVAIWVSPKRHVTFYRDESKQERLLEVLQDNKFTPINATYTILDADRNPLGKLRKNYLYNFIRRRWYCYGADNRLLFLALEDSLILALMRRLLGILVAIFPINFIFTLPDTDHVLGEFNRKFTLFDRYVLDMSRDPQHVIDRRIALALGVMLDTGERR